MASLDDSESRPRPISDPTGREMANSSSSSPPRPRSTTLARVASQKVSKEENPLNAAIEHVPAAKSNKKASLSIKLEDEIRIVNAVHDAAKKKTTGNIYSVIVDLSNNNSLSIGVKDLTDNLLVVSLLKRENNIPGAGEAAGIRLGDVLFGINFLPTRQGSSTLISHLNECLLKHSRYIHIQGWRCHQLCSDPVPGYLFPRADEMFAHAYSLYSSKIFSHWEQWNFLEILLSHLVDDLRSRSKSLNMIEISSKALSSAYFRTSKQLQILDLEHNIMQAKGLRTSLNVRIVHTKSREDDTVLYILRVEDIESGLQWILSKRYTEFYSLHEELNLYTTLVKDIEFPKKRMSYITFAKGKLAKRLVEERIVQLEIYLRKALHVLTMYGGMEKSASVALRHLQVFLTVEKYINCLYPPIIDDQRSIELLTYRFLNDYSSPACQQCVKFIGSVDLVNMVDYGGNGTPPAAGAGTGTADGKGGYHALLTFLHDALAEVENFVTEQHKQQLLQVLTTRRPEWNTEKKSQLITQCIRRQVENALYLPLRRSLFKIIQGILYEKIVKLSHAIQVLQKAKPSIFGVPFPDIQAATLWPKAIKAMRRAILAYLPSDQGQLLIEAANSIAALHAECQERANARLKAMEDEDKGQARSSLITRKPADFRPSTLSASSDEESEEEEDETNSKEQVKIKEERKEEPRGKSLFDEPLPRQSSFSAFTRSITSFMSPTSPATPPPPPQLDEAAMEDKMDQEIDSCFDTTSGVDDGRISFSTHIAVVQGTNSSIRAHSSNTPSSVLRRLSSKTSDTGTVLMPPSPLPLEVPVSEKTVQFSSIPPEDEQPASGTVSPSTGSSRAKSADVVDGSLFADVFDRHEKHKVHLPPGASESSNEVLHAISADDFLPLFTYTLVFSSIPQLLLLKEVMVHLIANEDLYGECGYYLATLEAAVQHIEDLASQFETNLSADHDWDDGEDMFHDHQAKHYRKSRMLSGNKKT